MDIGYYLEIVVILYRENTRLIHHINIFGKRKTIGVHKQQIRIRVSVLRIKNKNEDCIINLLCRTFVQVQFFIRFTIF